MNVSWTAPGDDGGAPIINYYLEQRLSTEYKWARVTTSQISNTQYVVEQLRMGKEYQYRVAAENKAGVGKYSEPSDLLLAKAPLGK